MVYSGTKAAPEAREHGGDITEDGPWAIRFDTGTDGEGDGTGVTQLDAEAGTVQDIGDVTGGAMSVIGTSTDVDDGRRDTGATIGEVENGTQKETEDVTLQGTDRVLISCEGAALT